MKKKTSFRKHPFTLLEIVLSIAILSIVAATTGWQIRNMVVKYTFEKSVGIFLTDLKQMQFLALANQVEIAITINKLEKDQKYYYKIYCDDPNKKINQSFQCLDHVTKILAIEKNKKRTIVKSQVLTIFRNGRIIPEKKLQFCLNQNAEKTIDLMAL